MRERKIRDDALLDVNDDEPLRLIFLALPFTTLIQVWG
jgi:hypothetical protein